MRLHVYSIWYNEAEMAPYFFRHYSGIADKIIIYCEPSCDGTEQIIASEPRAELRVWPWRGLDDDKFTMAVNNWYKESRGEADWVCWPDADELLLHKNLRAVLERAKGDVMPATGYALISEYGWPANDGHSQIYDLVRTGVRQHNYDKRLIWRANIDLEHATGRHTYLGWPKHNGVECKDAGVKLIHCHFVGGPSDTAIRNQRCYDRSTDKSKAWNYSPQHNKPTQVGTVSWVENILSNHKLEKIP
jgi:hypothetical protein